MKLYNTISRKVEEFEPLRASEVTLYTCGPTVYDHAHIGNLRTYVFEDTLRRTLKLSGYKVKHVMNITDVDDKTIKRSHEDYPDEEPLSALKKLTSHFEQIFFDDAKKVGIDLSDSTVAKATEHIAEMQELIRKIRARYTTEDGIYFDIQKYPEYGRFVKLDRSHEHHRIANDEYDKEHVADFALWKAKKEREPSWDFEIDGQNIPGRPGWHIECSAMSTHYLGQPFDIHTGGVDLMFPHHENEVAQSKSASDKDLARFFIHAQHLLVGGKKMSKSLNNFYSLDDIIKKGIEPLAFRLLVLQAHYRTQMNLTWESLDAAAQNLKDLQAWADLVHQPSVIKQIDEAQTKNLEAEIKAALSDDLNTARALATVSEFVGKLSPSAELLRLLDDVFGLELHGRGDIDDELKALMSKREQARQNQDWQQSDRLRSELTDRGLVINDTPSGPIWSRK